MDFTVDSSAISQPAESMKLHRQVELCLDEAIPNLTRLIEDLTPSGGFLLNYSGPNELFVTLRGHKSGLVSIQMENYGESFIMDNRSVLALEKKISSAIHATRSKSILPLKRGLEYDQYFYSSDERLLEYKIDELLFDAKTAYQHVQLVRTREFGVALALDGFINLAEKDLAYTQCLMGSEEYCDKTVLILGGGDGGLLNELLKHKPKHVTMVEIDEVVMQQCRIHMRSVCGSSLDNYKGDNYEVIVGDAFKFMQECLSSGRQFDYIFYDLTDVPVSPQRDPDVWKLVRQALSDGIQLLPPGGKYMTHVTGLSSRPALDKFESLVDSIPCKTSRVHHEALVPSFMEIWVFYHITKH